MNLSLSLVVISALIMLIAIVGSFDKQDQVNQANTYCEMVTIHKLSNGRNGWPDFENSYNKRCL